MGTRAHWPTVAGVLALATATGLLEPVSAQGTGRERGIHHATLENGLQVVVAGNPARAVMGTSRPIGDRAPARERLRA